MAYLDEVTGKVYDGNFVIFKGKKTRIRTTYRFYITVNDKFLFEGFTNQDTKKEALTHAIKAIPSLYDALRKKINLNFDDSEFSFKTKISIKKVKDKRIYDECDLKLIEEL